MCNYFRCLLTAFQMRMLLARRNDITIHICFFFLRSCNLEQDDAGSLRHALNCMPNLVNLDLSDNPIEDGIRYTGLLMSPLPCIT